MLVSESFESVRDPSLPTGTLATELADLQVKHRRALLRSQRDVDPCTTSATGGCVNPPVVIRRVQPHYPQNLRDAPIAARVIVEGRIGTDGFLTGLRLVTVPSEFADAALDALAQWEFEAARLNGVPVEADITVTVDFR